MASRRLTRALKDQIIENAQKATFQGREEKLEIERNTLVLSLRARILGDWALEYLSMPRNLVSTEAHSLRAVIGGWVYVVFLPRTPDNSGRRAHPDIRVPDVRLELSTEDALAQAVVSFDERSSALAKERSEVATKLHALLDSVTTVNRLLEVWPEGEPYIPKEEGPGQELVSVIELNSLLVAARSRG